jgi:PhnB protein
LVDKRIFRRLVIWSRLGAEALMTEISPMLAVSDGNKAIAFYKAACGAEVLWQIEHNGEVVAGLAIDGAKFFLAHESPDYGTRGPDSAGFTTVRIELFVDDPAAVYRQAVAAGATDRDRVQEYEYEMMGPKPIKKMVQGSVVDPFGHVWLIGKILE